MATASATALAVVSSSTSRPRSGQRRRAERLRLPNCLPVTAWVGIVWSTENSLITPVHPSDLPRAAAFSSELLVKIALF